MQDLPGPGNYSTDANVLRKSVQSYGMAKAARHGTLREKQPSPGPGRYNTP